MTKSTAEPKLLLEMSEAARVVGVSPSTIRTWADSGKLRVAVVTGRGQRLFDPRDLDPLVVS